MKRYSSPKDLVDLAGIWREDAEKLAAADAGNDQDLIERVRSEGVDELSARSGVPAEQLRSYQLIAESSFRERNSLRRTMRYSLASIAVLAVAGSVWAWKEAPSEENRLYSGYLEAREEGESERLARVTGAVDEVLHESMAFGVESGADADATEKDSQVDPDVADLAVIRASAYLQDGCLDCAIQLNRRLIQVPSHRGYARNNLANAYLRQAVLLYSLRSTPDPLDVTSAEMIELGFDPPFDRAVLNSIFDAAVDSAEFYYNAALESIITGGGDPTTLRTTIEHNIFNLQAHMRGWQTQEEEEDKEQARAAADSILNRITRIDTIVSALPDTESDTVVLLLHQLRVVERDTASDDNPER